MDTILVRLVMGILGLAIVLGGLYLICAALITVSLFVGTSRRAETMRQRVLSAVRPLAPPGVSRAPYMPPSEPPGV